MSLRLPLALCCCALALLGASPTPSSPPPRESEPPASELLALVRAHNAREIGAPGWRRASLELVTNGQVTRRFTITNLWQQDATGLRTLFLLEEPAGLRGTSYLLDEPAAGARPMQVHLYLPAGERRVLEIAPRLHDEGLLGSDFGYRELCWHLPSRGYTYREAGEGLLLGRKVRLVDALPADAELAGAMAWARLRYHLSVEPPMVLGIDFFRKGQPEGQPPAKQLRVEALEQRSGVWTPTRIVVTQGQGRASVLTLQDVRFGLAPLPAGLLTPDALPGVAEHLRAGKPAEHLLPAAARAAP